MGSVSGRTEQPDRCTKKTNDDLLILDTSIARIASWIEASPVEHAPEVFRDRGPKAEADHQIERPDANIAEPADLPTDHNTMVPDSALEEPSVLDETGVCLQLKFENGGLPEDPLAQQKAKGGVSTEFLTTESPLSKQSSIDAPDLPDGLSKLHSKIDIEILRAASLRRTLSGFGMLWRTRPDAHRDPARLYDHSFQCEKIDEFLSHSWATPGWLKYTALSWRCDSGLAAAWSLFVGMILSILTYYDVLPILGTYESSLPGFDWEGEIRVSFWCILLGGLVFLGVHFGDTILVDRFHRTNVFLDVVCIHQVDPVKKQEGIDSLAGFLVHSKQMTVLWSQMYFTRLWCVYELASYLMLNPQGKIQFCPILEVVAMVYIFVVWWLYYILFTLAFSIGLLSDTSTVAIPALSVSISLPDANTFLLAFFCQILVAAPLVHQLRKFMMHKREMKRSLKHFDCRKAECHLEEDRERVMRRIREWYGSEDIFNTVVRGRLNREAQKAMVRSYANSFPDYMKLSVPLVLNAGDWVAAFAKSTCPRLAVAAITIAMVGGAIAFSLYVHVLLVLVDGKFGKWRKSIAANIFITIKLAVTWMAMHVMVLGVGAHCYKRSFVWSLIWIMFWLILVAIVLLRGKRQLLGNWHKKTQAPAEESSRERSRENSQESFEVMKENLTNVDARRHDQIGSDFEAELQRREKESDMRGREGTIYNL